MIKNAPEFDNVFLRSVVESFHARSKSINYNTQALKLEMEMEEFGERLNVDVESYASPPYQIRLSLWGDCSAYFRTCQSSKNGWKHMIALSGHLGTCNAGEIEQRFEKSFAICTLSGALSLWPELEQC